MRRTINMKRTLAVCIAAILFVLSCVMQISPKTQAANTAQSYKVFNAQTGEYLREYTLSPLRTENNSRTIIGTDDRVVDWSKSGVVKLMTVDNYIGSGFVVDAHTIATAAHCAFDIDNQTGSIITKILLFDSNGNVSMSATPVESHVPIEFITNNKTTQKDYKNVSDYALITVKEDLSDYMCFELGIITRMTAIIGEEINVTGFPLYIDKYAFLVNTYTTHTMYTGTGMIASYISPSYGTHSEPNKILSYMADATPGNSGGPVYMTETRCGKTYNTVIGINVQSGEVRNYGTMIDTNVLHFLKNNENILY